MAESSGAWWRDAVLYQVCLRSVADGTGDGIGDLPGVRARLPYLSELGVDGLWLTPWYPSPMQDVADIEPQFGTPEDARALVDDASAFGLKVIFDFGPDGLRADPASGPAEEPGRPDLSFLADVVDEVVVGPERLRRTIDDSLAAFAAVGASPTWTLPTHDGTRLVTRFDRGWTGVPLPWPFPETDLALGTRRARAMLLLLLALPGSVFLHQGEELGLREAEDRSGLPQPVAWRDHTAEAQERQPDSMPGYYRTALATRRTLAADVAPTLTWLGGPDGVVAFARGNFGCMVNLSAEPVPAVGPVLLSSASVADGLVPPDTAVWTSGLPGADQAAQHTVHEGR